jgi:hypothetical protein
LDRQQDDLPGIPVWVINTAHVDEKTLSVALSRAKLIFQNAGVRLTWLQSPRGTIPSGDTSRGLKGSDMLVLRIVTYPAGEFISPNALGFAVAHQDDSTYATVFGARVLDMVARGGPCSEAELLGHAIAHELGHLLLNSPAHSRHGLMAATWRAAELDRASSGNLLFSAGEAAVIRASAVRRGIQIRMPDTKP